MGQVIKISSREFSAHPLTYLRHADQGAKVVISRRQKVAYTLTPIEEEEEELSPALLACIEEGLQDYRQGKGRVYTPEELRKRMGL